MDTKNTDSTEDRLIAGLVDRLNDDVMPNQDSADSEAERLLREYTELLGLLPYEAEEQAPAARVKEQLLATIEGDRAADDAVSEQVAEIVPIRPAGGLRWALPVAATVAFVLLGFSSSGCFPAFG